MWIFLDHISPNGFSFRLDLFNPEYPGTLRGYRDKPTAQYIRLAKILAIGVYSPNLLPALKDEACLVVIHILDP
jgi:hypothetical protein